MLFVGPLVTLAITPWFNFDPINLGKILVLTTLAWGGIFLLMPYTKEAIRGLDPLIKIASVCFIFALVAPLLLTSAPISQQIWGQFGRGTGIWTYVSLLFIFLIAALQKNLQSIKKVMWSLTTTQIIMTFYCLLQIVHKDPIKWSAFWTFGTLGNVNFLSGFMGIAVVLSLCQVFNTQLKKTTRLSLFALSVLDIFIVATTDSIQGIVAFALGFATYIGFRSWKLGRGYLASYSVLFAASFVSLILALFDKGPLRSIIYQVTITYRGDYMHAGLKMLLNKPLTGVGIDSYDDWYRSERGIVSAFRTGFSRTANTAHNVMLDLGAGGGFPLLIAYLLLTFVVLKSIYVGLRSKLVTDPNFMALICAWIAYQVQAAVSINQIGVGVWGWIFGGLIVGFEKTHSLSLGSSGITNNSIAKSGGTSQKISLRVTSSKQKKVPNTPPPLAVICSAIGLSIGFFISFLPMKTDMDFRSGLNQGKLEIMMKSTSGFATNAFLLAQANQAALKNGFQDQARVLNDRLTSKFPRYIYGWQSRLNLSNLTNNEREQALEQIQLLDPYLGLCGRSDWKDEIVRILQSIPSNMQYELSRGWGLTKPTDYVSSENFAFSSLPLSVFQEKVATFCTV